MRPPVQRGRILFVGDSDPIGDRHKTLVRAPVKADRLPTLRAWAAGQPDRLARARALLEIADVLSGPDFMTGLCPR